MSKYKYKRDVFKGLTPFPFLGEVGTRLKNIDAAPAVVPKSVYNPNIIAASLHPEVQHTIVSKVIIHGDAKSFVLVPDKEQGTSKLAYFRAGQYVSVNLTIDGSTITRPYTICSGPKAALGEDGSYTLTIKNTPGGFASPRILNDWKEGTRVDISAPLGNFYYQELRDAKSVIGIAGGSGITMFMSMAAAIVSGAEDFNLTILYGSRTLDSILLRDELESLAAASNGKVKVVHVLSAEERDGFEHGFITADIIKKYAPAGDFSVFMCGPKVMYDFAKGECRKLGLKNRRIRAEVGGELKNITKRSDYPKTETGEFSLTVIIRGEKRTIAASSDESLLVSMEKAGIKAPSHCRSGECGWCHSRLVSGEVFIPEEADKRRMGDKKFGWIHPCITYPLGDVEIEVFPTA